MQNIMPSGFILLSEALERYATANDFDQWEAEWHLRTHLSGDAFPAYLEDAETRSRSPLEPSIFARSDSLISFQSSWIGGDPADELSALFPGNDDGPIGRILVKEVDLGALLHPPGTESRVTALTDRMASPQGRKRGRPPKWDWEGLLVETIRVVHEEGVPDSLADLKKKMLAWCQANWKDEPAVSEVSKRASAVWHALRPPEN